RNECCRCAWHESLIEVHKSRCGGNSHAVLRIWKNFANGSYGNVNLTGSCVLEVTNIVEVRDILKEQGVRAAGARARRQCRRGDLEMIVHKRTVHFSPATYQQRGQFKIGQVEARRYRYCKLGILSEVDHQIIADDAAVRGRCDAR